MISLQTLSEFIANFVTRHCAIFCKGLQGSEKIFCLEIENRLKLRLMNIKQWFSNYWKSLRMNLSAITSGWGVVDAWFLNLAMVLREQRQNEDHDWSSLLFHSPDDFSAYLTIFLLGMCALEQILNSRSIVKCNIMHRGQEKGKTKVNYLLFAES